MMKKLYVAIVATIAALSVAACSSLPTSGPVTESDISGSQAQPLSQEALGPVKGADETRLVRDFIRACAAGVYDNYTVARSYLTPEAARAWRPKSNIFVAEDESSMDIFRTDRGVTIKTPLRETINGAGTQVKEGGVYDHTLTLKRNKDGEWRISWLPAGIVISRAAFVNAYSQRSVFFLSKDRKVLSPEPRWVPQQKTLSTLVDYLNKGPSQTFSQVASTAFPLGKNVVDHVKTNGSVAVVTFNDRFMNLSPRTRSFIIWQLDGTIRNAGGITRVEYFVGEQPVVDKAPSIGTFDMATMMGINKKGDVVQVDDKVTRTVVQADSVPGDLSWPTRGPLPDNPVVVLSDSTGIYTIPDIRRPKRSEVSLLYRGKHMAPPSVDRCGWIWSANTHGTNGLVVVDKTGNYAEIQQSKLPLADKKLISLDVSLDGARFVGLYEDANGNQTVEHMLIDRGVGCEPKRLIAGQDVKFKVREARQVTWVSPTSFAIYGTYDIDDLDPSETTDPATQAKAIETIPLTGDRAIVECRSDTQTVFGGGESSSLYLVTDKANRYRLYGTQWRKDGTGLTTPSFPG